MASATKFRAYCLEGCMSPFGTPFLYLGESDSRRICCIMMEKHLRREHKNLSEAAIKGMCFTLSPFIEEVKVKEHRVVEAAARKNDGAAEEGSAAGSDSDLEHRVPTEADLNAADKEGAESVASTCNAHVQTYSIEPLETLLEVLIEAHRSAQASADNALFTANNYAREAKLIARKRAEVEHHLKVNRLL